MFSASDPQEIQAAIVTWHRGSWSLKHHDPNSPRKNLRTFGVSGFGFGGVEIFFFEVKRAICFEGFRFSGL